MLGICLGMELAFEYSTEQGGSAGLGIIPGEVRALRPGSLKLPHIGWNEVRFTKPALAAHREPAVAVRLLPRALVRAGPRSRSRMCWAPPSTARRSSRAVERGSFYGVQFHPEKSSAAGLRLLANFAAICATAQVPVAR